MKVVTLIRLESGDQGTFGRIDFEGHTYFTLELPWRSNRNDISCIPFGSYRCDMTRSPRFRRKLYLLDSVPGRNGIRIHPANFARQLNGCIALGKSLGVSNGFKGVFLSQTAVREFEDLLEGKSFILEVKNGMA